MSTGYYVVRGKSGAAENLYCFYVDLLGSWPTHIRQAFRFPKLSEATDFARSLYSEPDYDGEIRYEAIDTRKRLRWLVRRSIQNE